MLELLTYITVDWHALLVQCVHLAALTLVVWLVFFKHVVARVEKRRAATIRALADAEHVRKTIKEAETKRTEILTQAHLDAEEIVKAARTEAFQNKAHESGSTAGGQAKNQEL